MAITKMTDWTKPSTQAIPLRPRIDEQHAQGIQAHVADAQGRKMPSAGQPGGGGEKNS